ncbi:MAG TPA: riboflavin synthase [Gaiellaceae bacterium]|nr:riboflavin synthase [Gaiellaceae bacterium]
MFTGIVQQLGRVRSFEDGRLVVERGAVDAAVGDSVAVNGVCLTVVERGPDTLAFDVVPETVSRVRPFAEAVNLEPALRAGDPMGGHVVQGHVDGVGRVRAVDEEGIWVDPSAELLAYVVEKGSIAVDGVSLTVAEVDDAGFRIALIPHTREVTTLGSLRPGDAVNLEGDVLAKYVERLLERRGLR